MTELPFDLKHSRPGMQRLPCPWCAKGRHDTALAVTVKPDGAVVWLCHRCGERGAWSERREHLPPPRPVQAPAPAGDLRAALAVYQAGRVITADDPVGRYLAGRDCAPPHREADLRWHPGLRHGPSGRTFPCILSLVTDARDASRPLTLHRTFLAADGSAKAPVERPRLLWPGLPKAGGCIRVVPDCEVTDMLALTEGVETALSAVALGYPTWATIDAQGMTSMPVLAGVEALLVFADRDRVNPQTGRAPGLAAARACAERWSRAGHEVRLWTPPTIGSDLNDVVRAA